MRWKDGVNLDLVPPLTRVLPVIDRIFEQVIGRECTVTSARDGQHKTHVHPDGEAVDLRVRDPFGTWTTTNEERHDLVIALQAELGHGFDVVLEQDPKDSNSHIHVEYDPK